MKLKEILKSKGVWIGAVIGIGLYYFLNFHYCMPQCSIFVPKFVNPLNNSIFSLIFYSVIGSLIGYFIEKNWRRR